MTRSWHVGRCRVTVDLAAGSCVTRWPPEAAYPDGLRLTALPNYGDEDRARAAALGYGDGDQALRMMAAEHDALHSFACFRLLGREESPVLRAAALGCPLPPEVAWPEEALVLHLQHALNAPKAHRPEWERRFLRWAGRVLRGYPA